ncbi:MAG TPA: response regulator [Burkholderiaceae bacterium]|nr:response regulator [Burkholderiaceae bacterium]
MIPLDSEIGGSTALVVDCNNASRSVLVNLLREFGVAEVMQARRAQDARRLLEQQRYDIVVCDYHFEGEPVSGQDLMDDLRLAQLLPLATVVVMISAEAGHAKVAEAAEAALDAYLIKPHTAEALRQRLFDARQRKRALKGVIALIEKEGYVEAAEMCQTRFETRGPAWLQAARIGAELWLRLGKPHAAQRMFDAILGIGAVPWARLGVARSQYDRGGASQARRSLESLLSEQPGYSDAYDVMARVLLDQDLPDEALAASREALSLTPGSVARLVKHGLLAFFYGDPGEAGAALARAARYGLHSKVFDLQGLVLLALVQFDKGDLRGLVQSWRSMTAARSGRLDSDRLRRFEGVIGVLKLLLERNVPQAVALARELVSESREPSFEFEAACNLLALLTRLTRDELRLESLNNDVLVLAQRFAVSRTTCELLTRSLQNDATLAKIVRDAYAAICAEAEDAVSNTLKGLPGEAARLLLTRAESTLNAKLMDLAIHTMDRHGPSIDDVEALRERAMALHKRYRSYGTQVHLGGAGDTRALTQLAKV